MLAQPRDARYSAYTEKLIQSLGGRKPARRADPSAPKAKDTPAAEKILKDHARRRMKPTGSAMGRNAPAKR